MRQKAQTPAGCRLRWGRSTDADADADADGDGDMRADFRRVPLHRHTGLTRRFP
jgi:hypothetical protein